VDLSMVLLALATGLMASASCRAWGRAVLLAEILSLITAMMLLAGAGRLIMDWVWGRPPVGWDSTLNWGRGLMLGMWMLVSGDHLPPAWWFGGAVAPARQTLASIGVAVMASALVAVGILLFIVAFRTARVWREKPAGPLWRWWERHFLKPRVGRVFLRGRLRRMLDRNPIGWLHQYSTGARVIKWGWCLFVVAAETLLVTMFNWYELLGLQMAFGLVVLIALAASSAGSFRRERETGAFELILVTPLREGQVMWGRLRGLYGQFLPAMVILLAAGLFLVQTRMTDYQMRLDWDSRWGEFAAVVVIGVGFMSLPAIGLWYSLVCRSFLQAWLWTLAAGIAAPMLFAAVSWVVLIWMIELGDKTGSWSEDRIGQFYYPLLGIWSLLSMAVHAGLVQRRLGRRERLLPMA
jgi:hypothetical protein